MLGRISWAVVFARALIVVPIVVGCSEEPRTLPACNTEATDAAASAGASADPVLLAAGDVVTCGDPAAERTARLIDGLPGTVAVLGDTVYEGGSLSEFLDCYEPTWGRHRARTRPAVGNHEYRTPHAAAYFAYFCGSSGEPYKGWYSYDLGAWHVVVLNSNCDQVGCEAGSEQEQWLRKDLAGHPSKCTLAYWHHPRFNSGHHGSDGRLAPMWDALSAYGAELVLNGHEHWYERFAPQSPSGVADEARGIREIVVGTGGRTSSDSAPGIANSVVRLAGVTGILALTLHESSYDFRFVRDDGQDLDSGHGECH